MRPERETKKSYLEAVLEALSETPGVMGCLVVDSEGFVLADFMPKTLNAEDAAAIASQLYGVSKNYDKALNHGAVDEILIRGSRRTTVLKNVDRGILATIVEEDANLGFIRMEVRKAAEKIRVALYEPTPVDRVAYRGWSESERTSEPSVRAEIPASSWPGETRHAREYIERRTSEPEYLETTPREKTESEAALEEYTKLKYDSTYREWLKDKYKLTDPDEALKEHKEPTYREWLMKKYRLKDPDKSFLSEVVAPNVHQCDCGGVLVTIKSDLVKLADQEAVDMEIENQLEALHADPQRLSCIEMRRLVSNLSDFLIAIAGEQEAKALLKRFDDYIPQHSASA